MIKARLLSDAVLAASAGSIVYISESQLKALGDKAEIVKEAEVSDIKEPAEDKAKEPIKEIKEEKPKTRKTIKKK